ncbi:MAG: bifunctional phosphoribosylaminoimidazolecarboxamide formyltransferase/IMP cyclohydrolase [Prevotella sp.]|nr:bifunctional phosphoribosylaminoimidazolecarboxamide formyltransferase/IMP cyclohydrolase [Bacteroides sp.]MCM1366411.1 bifunctional phosphoribosylaminoimidazolecarboxamide formyltransferase/IMP cyclohydrolase [Prevotella sp.]
MTGIKKIKSALISVYHKDGLEDILKLLVDNNVRLISTGGTHDFILSLGYDCDTVESLTGYPSILGGRVKTLHPTVFGGILRRRECEADINDSEKYLIPEIDLVIVDLYPFEDTVASGQSHDAIIEKIDIGGISLIRGAAKNYNDVVIVASKKQYEPLLDILKNKGAETTLEERFRFARWAFGVSSAYDSAIYSYFDRDSNEGLRLAIDGSKSLRYGENPHQKGCFYGDFEKMFKQLHGKEISYNNLLDIDAAVSLIKEFDNPTIAILKHNNACGIATREDIKSAWITALACDPVSAFGGVIISNRDIDKDTAEEIGKIFFEVIIAPRYSEDALAVLKEKKNRIILASKDMSVPVKRYRSALNGLLSQDFDNVNIDNTTIHSAGTRECSPEEYSDLLFANKVVKHSKSNAIVLVKNGRLLGSGVGQTSRVDALKHAIEKAISFGFDLRGACMASDAFFPFKDCVELAHEVGITSVIHPGGSIRDSESIDFCKEHDIAMLVTGIRHFRH